MQEPHESIDQFATRLRNLSDHCQFENVDDAVRDQLVKTCLSTKLKKFALREVSLEGGQCHLKSLLHFGRAQERGESQARQMNSGNSSNNDLGHAYAVNSRKKDGCVKLSKLSRKTPQKSGKTLLLSQRNAVFIVVVTTHILQLALHKASLVGLAGRLEICKCLSFKK